MGCCLSLSCFLVWYCLSLNHMLSLITTGLGRWRSSRVTRCDGRRLVHKPLVKAISTRQSPSLLLYEAVNEPLISHTIQPPSLPLISCTQSIVKTPAVSLAKQREKAITYKKCLSGGVQLQVHIPSALSVLGWGHTIKAVLSRSLVAANFNQMIKVVHTAKQTRHWLTLVIVLDVRRICAYSFPHTPRILLKESESLEYSTIEHNRTTDPSPKQQSYVLRFKDYASNSIHPPPIPSSV